MLPRVEYIHWIVGRPAAATHDLGSSDLRFDEMDHDQVVPTALQGREGPEPSVTLEEQLAAEYGVESDKVIVTAGATHAYVLAVAAALNGDDGDRVLVERPGYEPLRRTPEALGADVHRFRRDLDEDHALSPDRVAAATTDETALAVATNRHNPSGRIEGAETLEAAVEAARSEGARLLIDEVYAPYAANEESGAFGGPTAAGLDGAVVTGSVTKFHGLGDLRIGWIIADEPFLERVEEAYAYLPVTAEPSRVIAARALANGDTLLPRARDRLRENHDLLAAFVADRPELAGPVHDGAPFAFLAHESATGDEVVEAAWERDLLVVPGRFFEQDERFRVSLGGAPEEMAAALDVLGETLDDL